MKDPKNMTVLEIKEYINTLDNDQIMEFAKIVNDLDREDMDDMDVLQLLEGAKLYDFLQYRDKGEVQIDLSF